MSKEKFIVTKDKNAAAVLLKAGFFKISDANGITVFMNNGPTFFSDSEKIKGKVVYTNTMFI